VDYATVHLLNGLDALKAANQTAKSINLKLLGVFCFNKLLVMQI